MNDNDKTVRKESVPPMSSGTQEQGGHLLQTGMMQPPQMPGVLGTIGKYQVIRILGEGGMGQVLLAREPVTDSLVAVKIIKPEFLKKEWAVHRFLTEARHMFKMSHPSLIRVLEVSDRPEGPYFVMPYMAGGSLAQKIKPGELLPSDTILPLARQVAEALQYAHARGIIHRDLKTSNILLDPEGRAYLCDFGLLRTVFNDSMVDVTRPQVEGTVPYMSPAIASGQAEDTRCDIYAFGCLLYEMLTGQTPYQGPTVDAILKQIQDGPPQPIRQLNPQALARLVAIAEHAMGRELRDRYATMSDVINDLDRAAQGKDPLGPHGGANVAHLGRNVLVVIGIVALISLGVFVLSTLPGRKASVTTTDRGSATTTTASPSPAAAPKERGILAPPETHVSALTTNPKLGEVCTLQLGSNVPMQLMGIPPGEFMLGSTKEEQAWAVVNKSKEELVKSEGEAPRKARIKDGFWLGRTEVTVGQWKQFVTATGYKTDAEKKGYVDFVTSSLRLNRVDGLSWRDPGHGAAPQDNDAVSCVSWNDAVAFCEWLTQRERKAGRLASSQVVRLPTEVEWEYACRAGTQTKFWWGESKDDGKGRLNWEGKDDGFEFVAPVDSFGVRGRNGFGLADMLGNVYEWCLDEYDAEQAHEECYKGNPGARVLRGGSCGNAAGNTRCAYRFSRAPADSNSYYGFRVAVGVDVSGATKGITAPVAAAPAALPPAAKDNPWTNSLGMRLVPIPGTKVLFCIWETRVCDFEAFVEETKRDMGTDLYAYKHGNSPKPPGGYNWRNPYFHQTPLHPVVGVSWHDARAFCAWLTEKERREQKITSAQTYRLPTDAEWSRAVGETTYPWGESWPPVGNYAGEEARDADWPKNCGVIAGYRDGFPRTAPVGSFPGNHYGLFDMGGNVWEWCEDVYRREMNTEEVRRKWTQLNDDGSQEKYRPLRGASWFNNGNEVDGVNCLASMFRHAHTPDDRDSRVGFRCVLAGAGGVAAPQAQSGAASPPPPAK